MMFIFKLEGGPLKITAQSDYKVSSIKHIMWDDVITSIFRVQLVKNYRNKSVNPIFTVPLGERNIVR